MHRFFLMHVALSPGQIVDLAPLAHQLQRVLRAQPGECILLLDNKGHEYLTELQQVEPAQTTGVVLTRSMVTGEPRIELTLYQNALKADKFEWVLQKGTELGVTQFVPVISSRTIVRPMTALTKKYPRWRTILREAAEQCGRGRIPDLAQPLEWDQAIQCASGVRLLPWEAAETNPGTSLVQFLGHALQPPSSRTMTAQAGEPRTVSLMIGPEGGLSGAEVDAARLAGWYIISLGRRVLRAETAALAAVAIVMAVCGEIG